jgi:phosphatidylglycerophosphate synthase
VISAVIVALPTAAEVKITGLTLVERARRVVRLCGIPDERVHVVRAAAELPVLEGPVVLVRADGWVVARELVLPLRPDAPGDRRAVDATGGYLGAVRVDDGRRLAAALTADFAAGDETLGGEPVVCTERARHPARSEDERRRADAWQFELVHKSLDNAVTRYFYRPLARPLTRFFLHTPFTPNAITIMSTLCSVVGCAIAAGPGYGVHVIGMALLVVGGVMDANDGEVARLRLEFTKFGGWLDAAGDELARIAVLLAVGYHVAPRYPSLPILPLTFLTLAVTLATVAMIYWYCIFIAKSSNSQAYAEVVGVGNDAPGEKTTWRRIADFGADLARRDAMDLGMLLFALIGTPQISFVVLVVGGLVGFGVVLPAHIRLVARRRRGVM